MKRMVAALATLLMVLTAGMAMAALPAGLTDDFATVDGVVLAVRKGAVLIDAAADQGVRVGELFSVLAAGEPLRHPVSGEPIPGLEEQAGVLVVTEVRPEFSLARQLFGKAPQAGDKVRRYDRVQSRFADPDGRGEALFAEVRAGLPQLDWQGYSKDAGKAGNGELLFLLQGNRLVVRSGTELLHSYTVDVAAAQPVTAPVATPAVAAPQGTEAAVPQTAQQVKEKQPSKWLGASVKKVPVAMVVADFDGDGKQEIARAFEDGIEIGRLVGGAYSRLQEIDLSGGRKGLSLAAFDLNGNGRPELFFSAAFADSVLTAVYEFSDKRYRKLADDQRWFVNTVQLADGPALLGQKRTIGSRPFAATVTRLKWQDGELREGETVSLPPGANIYGIAAFPAAGGGKFLRINGSGRLVLASLDAEELWASEQSGDTEIGFRQAEGLAGDDSLSRSIYLPGPLQVAGDGLVVTAFSSGFTGSNVFRQLTSAEIVGWRWEGYELQPKWRIPEIEGYIPALTVADADNDGVAELVMLLAYPNSNPFASRRSVIRLLALN